MFDVDSHFVVGMAYLATPSMNGAKKRLFVCTDRDARSVTFAQVDGIYRLPIGMFDGRETARIQSRDGFDYFATSTVSSDVKNAADVIEAISR